MQKLSVYSSIISIIFFVLIPLSYFIRKYLFDNTKQESSQLISSIAYGLYMLCLMLYSLNFEKGESIILIVVGIIILGMGGLIYSMLIEKSESNKLVRRTELKNIYFVFNFVIIVALMSHSQ
jgi:hypothetical protein